MSTSEIIHPKIAYVEIEADLRELIINGLQKHGFVVAGYDSSESFLSDFKAGLFDLVISNTRLPKMRGFDLYRYIKRIDAGQKYIFLSAFWIYSEEEIKKQFPDIDRPFLRLPILIKELVGEINNTLGIALPKAE